VASHRIRRSAVLTGWNDIYLGYIKRSSPLVFHGTRWTTQGDRPLPPMKFRLNALAIQPSGRTTRSNIAGSGAHGFRGYLERPVLGGRGSCRACIGRGRRLGRSLALPLAGQPLRGFLEYLTTVGTRIHRRAVPVRILNHSFTTRTEDFSHKSTADWGPGNGKYHRRGKLTRRSASWSKRQDSVSHSMPSCFPSPHDLTDGGCSQEHSLGTHCFGATRSTRIQAIAFVKLPDLTRIGGTEVLKATASLPSNTDRIPAPPRAPR
jgi:hypothetical protein